MTAIPDLPLWSYFQTLKDINESFFFISCTVGDSPCSERKDHIKKFLKEVKDCYKDKEAVKETKEKDGKEPKVPATPSASDSESVKSSRSLRLFRTVSNLHKLIKS